MPAPHAPNDVAPNAHDEHGRRSGPWEEKDPHGGVVRGELLDKEKHGSWQRFTAESAPIDEVPRDRGRRTGERTYHAPDGTVRKRTAHRGRPA